jgi:hypothetical protein
MNTPTLHNDVPYAYVFARESNGFANVEILLRRLIKSGRGYLYSQELTVRCSINRDWDYVYATKIALANPGVHIELPELEASMKAMTGIAKKLKKMEDELGYANDSDFTEFARRVLFASGIRTMFYKPTFNHGARDSNGLQLKEGIFGLRTVDPRDGKDFLRVVQHLTDDTLAKCGLKKAAI